ncbi:MAG: M28 family peptidase [Bacteroidales bacterium]|nr:M28 family peptidase [Bacteroidales bacterium]
MLKNSTLLTALIALSIPLTAQFSTTAEQLENHVYTLASDSLLGRGFGTEQGVTARNYIAQQFREAGIEPLNGDYFHLFNHRDGILNIPGANVVGIIRGNDPNLRDEYIILGAHYDHLGWKISSGDTVVYNGADDNASGTASIIEIGRNLVKKQESLGRSVIIVAFDGEESGLIGSTHFVEDSIVPPHKIKLMFSLDMVGMYEAHQGLELVGVELLNDYERIIGELAGEYNITIKKTNRRIEQRTDTAPFGKIGIPAIHTYTGLESPYHKPEDVPEDLDYDGMALVANYISATTLQLSSTEKLSDMTGPLEGQIAASGPKVFRIGLRLNIGSSHHKYQEEFYQGKSIFAAEAGVFASIRAASFLTIQPEVLYETKGSKHMDGTFRTHSVTTPLSLLITTPDNAVFRTYLQLGGYYSYHFGGKLGDDKIDFQDAFNVHEFGITYGFGFEIMNVQWGVYMQKGLSELLQDPARTAMTHKNVYFMLGFIF